MNDAHQFHAIEKRNVENDVGLGNETANLLLLNLRTLATHERLLRHVGDNVVQAAQIFIGSRFTGFARDVAPNVDEILNGPRPANYTRHRLGVTLIAGACFRDDGFHVERLSGTTVQAFADRGAQGGEL